MILNYRVVLQNLPLFGEGLYYTLMISAVCMISAFFVAVFISAGMETKSRWVVILGKIYMSINRNTPGLVKLYFIYFGAPALGLFPGPVLSGILAITLHNSGYMIEILRGGYLSIPRTQYEAAKALGMSNWRAIVSVLFPQVFRNALPSIGNYWVNIVKQTSLTSAVSVTEILYYTRTLSGEYMRPIEFFSFAAFLYLVIILSLQITIRKWEKRYEYTR